VEVGAYQFPHSDFRAYPDGSYSLISPAVLLCVCIRGFVLAPRCGRPSTMLRMVRPPPLRRGGGLTAGMVYAAPPHPPIASLRSVQAILRRLAWPTADAGPPAPEGRDGHRVCGGPLHRGLSCALSERSETGSLGQPLKLVPSPASRERMFVPTAGSARRCRGRVPDCNRHRPRMRRVKSPEAFAAHVRRRMEAGRWDGG
jgi:hypothetical protein